MNTNNKEIKDEFQKYEIKTSASSIKAAYLARKKEEKPAKVESIEHPSFFSRHKKVLVIAFSCLALIGVSIGTYYGVKNAANQGSTPTVIVPDKDFTNKKEKASYQLVSALTIGESIFYSSIKAKNDSTTYEAFVEATSAYRTVESTINTYFATDASFPSTYENGSFVGTYATYSTKMNLTSSSYFLYNGVIEEDEDGSSEEESEQEITGEIINNGATYKVEGEIEKEGNESELEFTVHFSSTNYVTISHEASNEDLSYCYEVYCDDSLFKKIEIEQGRQDKKLVYEITLETTSKKYEFVAYQGEKTKVTYSFDSYSGSFVITSSSYLDNDNSFSLSQ
jgi:hypothetical protein